MQKHEFAETVAVLLRVFGCLLVVLGTAGIITAYQGRADLPVDGLAIGIATGVVALAAGEIIGVLITISRACQESARHLAGLTQRAAKRQSA